MDVKLRSLICLGLNEQVLHLWLESLASNEEVVRKWFHPWSYMSSPGWVQVKCELRLLAQFSFNLTCDWELKPHLQGRRHRKKLWFGLEEQMYSTGFLTVIKFRLKTSTE